MVGFVRRAYSVLLKGQLLQQMRKSEHKLRQACFDMWNCSFRNAKRFALQHGCRGGVPMISSGLHLAHSAHRLGEIQLGESGCLDVEPTQHMFLVKVRCAIKNISL